MERRERGRAKAAKHAAPRKSPFERASNIVADLSAKLVNPDPEDTIPGWLFAMAMIFCIAITGLVEASSWPM